MPGVPCDAGSSRQLEHLSAMGYTMRRTLEAVDFTGHECGRNVEGSLQIKETRRQIGEPYVQERTGVARQERIH